jgi:hypothetical protein
LDTPWTAPRITKQPETEHADGPAEHEHCPDDEADIQPHAHRENQRGSEKNQGCGEDQELRTQRVEPEAPIAAYDLEEADHDRARQQVGEHVVERQPQQQQRRSPEDE